MTQHILIICFLICSPLAPVWLKTLAVLVIVFVIIFNWCYSSSSPIVCRLLHLVSQWNDIWSCHVNKEKQWKILFHGCVSRGHKSEFISERLSEKGSRPRKLARRKQVKRETFCNFFIELIAMFSLNQGKQINFEKMRYKGARTNQVLFTTTSAAVYTLYE